MILALREEILALREMILAMREKILVMREMVLAMRENILAVRENILAVREMVLAMREMILALSKTILALRNVLCFLFLVSCFLFNWGIGSLGFYHKGHGEGTKGTMKGGVMIGWCMENIKNPTYVAPSWLFRPLPVSVGFFFIVLCFDCTIKLEAWL